MDIMSIKCRLFHTGLKHRCLLWISEVLFLLPLPFEIFKSSLTSLYSLGRKRQENAFYDQFSTATFIVIGIFSFINTLFLELSSLSTVFEIGDRHFGKCGNIFHVNGFSENFYPT